MAGIFRQGEVKTRPGVYTRIESATAALTGAPNGIVAAVFNNNWGPANEPKVLNAPADIATVYGAEESEATRLLYAAFAGGALQVLAVRACAQTGNVQTHVVLTNQVGGGATTEVVKVKAKHPTTMTFTVSVQASLETGKKDVLFYDATSQELLEKYTVRDSEFSGLDLDEQISASSRYFATSDAETGAGNLVIVTQKAFTAGTYVTPNAEDFSKALNTIEGLQWEVLVTDRKTTEGNTLPLAFVRRIYAAGSLPILVLVDSSTAVGNVVDSQPGTVKINDPKVVLTPYAKTDYASSIAGTIAGTIASASASESLTHRFVPVDRDWLVPLTGDRIEAHIKAGVLLITTSSKGEPWIESGITTLVEPEADQDAGWKKIRRTKTRFELISRINAATESLIGKVNNDATGRTTIASAAQAVINQMIGEGKLLEGKIQVDPSASTTADSAAYVVAVDDLDSIEKIYLTFRFRFQG